MENDKLFLKTLFKKAYDLYLEETYEDSQKLLSQTQDLWFDEKDKCKFLTLFGMNSLKLKNFERAKRSFFEVLAIFPHNPKIYDMLGEVYYSEGKYVESEKMYVRAKEEDFFNFDLTLKSARSAWKSGNYIRMFKRLKDGYIVDVISKEEEKELKKFLLEFLKTSNYPETYSLVKNFRDWQFVKKKESQSYNYRFRRGRLWQKNI